jgi:hypothetical protein
LFAPAAPVLARRFGLEGVLFSSLLAITIGSLVRSLGIAPLYLGTMLVRASLCFLGVLTPALFKRDFRSHRRDDGKLHHDDLHWAGRPRCCFSRCWAETGSLC